MKGLYDDKIQISNYKYYYHRMSVLQNNVFVSVKISLCLILIIWTTQGQ